MPHVRTHPGEVLAEEYMHPLGCQRRDMSADTAIRLRRLFGVDPLLDQFATQLRPILR